MQPRPDSPRSCARRRHEPRTGFVTDRSLLAHRLRRHGLLSPAGDEGEFVELVRRLQPVTPVARDMPGAPPRLMHRCRGDDRELADRLRARQELLKGRFSGGRIAYVLAADFELYAAAFRRR